MKEAYFPPEFLENDQRKPYGNDIALLILREGFQLVMGRIDVIPLPPKNYQPIGEIILFNFFIDAYRLTFFRNFHLFTYTFLIEFEQKIYMKVSLCTKGTL